VLAGIANLLNLEAAVVGGGVSRSWDLLRPAAEAEVAKRAFHIPGRRMRILPSRLVDDAGVLGAARLADEVVRGAGPP
jgi:glucokinase